MDVEIGSHDTATLLSRLASQLRRDGLALTGMAYESSRPGQVEFRTLTEMAAGMERTALTLEVVSASLCRTCKMKPVSERLVSSAR